MNRQVQQTGIRKYFGADLVGLQEEPLKALDALFSEYGPCIIQGCEATPTGDAYDLAPGMVALRAADPDGTERVMVMPFGGASGVSLPVWLVAQDTIQERVYGDGKVKPVAHSYAAVVTATEPGEGVSSLQITGGGAPRLVDVMQDAVHRFVSDADKARWDARVTAAQLTEAITGKADTATVEAALAGKADKNGSLEVKFGAMNLSAKYINLAEGVSDDNMYLGYGAAISSDFSRNDMVAYNERPGGSFRIISTAPPTYAQTSNPSLHHILWHSGNFDPAAKADVAGRVIHGGIDAIPFDPGLSGNDIAGIELDSTLTLPGIQTGYATQLRIRDYAGSTEASIRGEQSKQWYGLWHSGNFDPARYPKSDVKGWRVETDCDNMTEPGTYDVNANEAPFHNCPLYPYGQIVVFRTQVAIAQIAFQYATGEMFVRTKYNTSNFSPWRTVYSNGNLGPATPSADGLMTAADKQKIDGMRGIVAAGKVRYDGGVYYSTPGVNANYYASGCYYTITFPAVSNPVVQVTPFDCPDKGNSGPAWGKVCCVIKTLTSSSATIVMTDSANGVHIRGDFCFSVISV